MFYTVDDLSCADLQNIDTRSTSAKDVFLIFADLENKRDWLKGKSDRFTVYQDYAWESWESPNWISETSYMTKASETKQKSVNLL